MELFAPDYSAARAQFRALAERAGARLREHCNQDAKGPRGEALVVDVARFGPASAEKVFLVISGTHGLEGFAGSAAQCAWLAEDGARMLAPNVAVVMVHAINPWGFAHRTRTTENNVDLNRNFIDHSKPHPANPFYAELHKLLCPREWTLESLAECQRGLDDFTLGHGKAALSDALRRGQYSHADGVFYGGRAREWSNRVLQQIVETELSGARKVGFVEWHTGLGDYAEDFFLCFHDPAGEKWRRACAWWGEAKLMRGMTIEGERRPDYSGVLLQAIVDYLPGREVVGLVVEFGTQRMRQNSYGTRADRWLKFACPDRATPHARQVETEVMEAFCPADPAWRRTVIEAGLRIEREGLAGIAAW